MKLKIYEANGVWWVIQYRRETDGYPDYHQSLRPDGQWTDNGSYEQLRRALMGPRKKLTEKYFNSFRWAIATAKRFHPKAKIEFVR